MAMEQPDIPFHEQEEIVSSLSRKCCHSAQVQDTIQY